LIRLLIAAPSAVVRAGLEALAASNPELNLVGVFADLSAADDLHPDVILASMPLSDISPPSNGHTPAMVLLSDQPHPVWSSDAVRYGVRAVLPRDASEPEILAAIDAAANGLAVMDPAELEQLLASAAPAAAAAVQDSTLTPRELEVLRMMAEGAANKIIAWKLNISEHTAKFHVASILSKLGASTRTEAVTMGIRKGLVLL